ncbi:MAG: endonuclease [Thermococcaceae archaeon]|nr:endonuclease [Thermococcaceae archaeon]
MKTNLQSSKFDGFTFNESWEEKKKRAQEIVKKLIETYPREKILIGDPYKTLIHCIISQRMRDEVTYKVWEELFKKYKNIKTIANIVKTSQIILEKYNGKVPEDINELMKLPGIGRKCANIVLAYGFGKQAIPVDTHVNRISKRLGLAPLRVSPEKVEEYLKELIPKDLWIYVNHAMVDHGKRICKPTNPKCNECPLQNLCPYAKGQIKEEKIK